MEVKVVGTAMVVKAAFTTAQVELLKKHNPESLTMYAEEDGVKTPVFQIGLGNNSVSKYGVTFGSTSADGNAVMTTMIEEVACPKEYVADKYGAALAKLAAMEHAVIEAADAAKASYEALVASIEVA